MRTSLFVKIIALFTLLASASLMHGQIVVNTNFQVNGNLPIDTRDTLTTLADTAYVDWTFPGLLSYAVDVDQFWYYNGSFWQQWVSGSGSADSSIYKLLPVQDVLIDANNNMLEFTNLDRFDIGVGTLNFIAQSGADIRVEGVGNNASLSSAGYVSISADLNVTSTALNTNSLLGDDIVLNPSSGILRIDTIGETTSAEFLLAYDTTNRIVHRILMDSISGDSGNTPAIRNDLPNETITIDPNNNDLQIGTNAANNTGEFEFYALNDASRDVTIYAGSPDSSSVVAGDGFTMDAFLSSFGGEDGIIGVNYDYLGTMYNAAMFGDSIFIGPYPAVSLALFINNLPTAASTSNKVGLVQDLTTAQIYQISLDSLGGGGADGNGLIDALPAGDVTIDAQDHDLAFNDLTSITALVGGDALGGEVNQGVFIVTDSSFLVYIFESLNPVAAIEVTKDVGGSIGMIAEYTDLLGRDSSQVGIYLGNPGETKPKITLYDSTTMAICADTLDATNVTTFLGFPTGADGNGLIDALPAGDVSINAATNVLSITNLEKVEFGGDTLELSDINRIISTSDMNILVTGLVGLESNVLSMVGSNEVTINSTNSINLEADTINVSNAPLIRTTNNLTVSADGFALITGDVQANVQSDSGNVILRSHLAETAKQSSIQIADNEIVFDADSIQIFGALNDATPDSLLGISGTLMTRTLTSAIDNQTLSSSRDTLTLADGNSIRSPGNGFLRDSITGAALTIDLKKYANALVEIRMESCTATTLTVNNPWSVLTDATYPTFEGQSGVYSFHFLSGSAMNDQITWPAAFVDMNGTALGTDTLIAGTMYTCYYNPVALKYYCK